MSLECFTETPSITFFNHGPALSEVGRRFDRVQNEELRQVASCFLGEHISSEAIELTGTNSN